jgi:hypothetical protein
MCPVHTLRRGEGDEARGQDLTITWNGNPILASLHREHHRARSGRVESGRHGGVTRFIAGDGQLPFFNSIDRIGSLAHVFRERTIRDGDDHLFWV